jgi:hypothetical protein
MMEGLSVHQFVFFQSKINYHITIPLTKIFTDEQLLKNASFFLSTPPEKVILPYFFGPDRLHKNC